jgi:hypothetical protein
MIFFLFMDDVFTYIFTVLFTILSKNSLKINFFFDISKVGHERRATNLKFVVNLMQDTLNYIKETILIRPRVIL